MNGNKRIGAWLSAPTFSPKGFLMWALLISVVFLVCRAAGLIEYTSIICGTSPTGNPADRTMIAIGLIYVLFHFSFVLMVPTLVLAAGIFAVLERGRRQSYETK